MQVPSEQWHAASIACLWGFVWVCCIYNHCVNPCSLQSISMDPARNLVPMTSLPRPGQCWWWMVTEFMIDGWVFCGNIGIGIDIAVQVSLVHSSWRFGSVTHPTISNCDMSDMLWYVGIWNILCLTGCARTWPCFPFRATESFPPHMISPTTWTMGNTDLESIHIFCS